MEEWRRFATMREVMTEFIKLVQFYRRDGQWRLGVYNEDFGVVRSTSLVLIDGIPVFDHQIVFDYNPLLLERIDVYLDRYLFGDNMFFGIVAMYTAGNRYPGLTPDPFTQILSYPSPQARRLFYSPSHDGVSDGGRIPDWRHTLYWDADVPVAGERAEVGFFTSDMPGRYNVLVEGITLSGEAFSATLPLEVSPTSSR
jgi:hypothetical protein